MYQKKLNQKIPLSINNYIHLIKFIKFTKSMTKINKSFLVK